MRHLLIIKRKVYLNVSSNDHDKVKFVLSIADVIIIICSGMNFKFLLEAPLFSLPNFSDRVVRCTQR